MPVRIETGDELVSAFLSGELDHHHVRQIREDIDETSQRVMPQLLRLDFSGVDFMDSSGIGLVLGRYKLMQDLGGRLSVTGLPRHLKKVMTIAGIDSLGVLDEGGTKDEK